MAILRLLSFGERLPSGVFTQHPSGVRETSGGLPIPPGFTDGRFPIPPGSFSHAEPGFEYVAHNFLGRPSRSDVGRGSGVLPASSMSAETIALLRSRGRGISAANRGHAPEYVAQGSEREFPRTVRMLRVITLTVRNQPPRPSWGRCRPSRPPQSAQLDRQ